MLPGSPVHDPVNQVISSEELRALVGCISTALSELESRVLALYLDGHSYEEVGRRIGCDCKTVDNALQRVKRKVGHHLAERNAAGGLTGQPPIAPSRGSRPNSSKARNRENSRWPGPWKSDDPVMSRSSSSQRSASTSTCSGVWVT